MSIDRFALVNRHNPTLRFADPAAPLSVGNGRFAYTADVTGTQTMYDTYNAPAPLCVMSGWGWHSFPNPPSRDELQLTEYDFGGRTVRYAAECKPGNEAVYHYLRQNPHRLNLARFALSLNGEALKDEDIADATQTLDLWRGVLVSSFTAKGVKCETRVACHPAEDTLAFELSGGLSLSVAFPYGSPLTDGSDWDAEDKHETIAWNGALHRAVDDLRYHVVFSEGTRLTHAKAQHTFAIDAGAFAVRFGLDEAAPAADTFEAAAAHWARFWQAGGAMDFSRCKDERAFELERRAVLSQYLLAINDAGDMPPAETGLTCNSWYGKFHLEMTPYHLAWAPLWNRGGLLEPVLKWYLKTLPVAKANAAANGYKGARWTKMVGPDGVDSPSAVATLLIWQQPHIIWMLDLMRGRGLDLDPYLELINETADFMADYPVMNFKTGSYDILPPSIPAQEAHKPQDVLNPTMELEYWQEMLKTAVRLSPGGDTAKWLGVAKHLARPTIKDGVYLAHENCPDTFEDFNRDHPSMAFILGRLKGERADRAALRATIGKVREVWQFKTLFGWDFGELAMAAARLGEPQMALELLLTVTDKNSYVANGHNYQFGYYQFEKNALPVYLPGNGALLLALALMAAGWEGNGKPLPGFPEGWDVEFENISPLP